MKLSCALSPDGPKLRHTRPRYRSMPKQIRFTLLGSRRLSLNIKTANPKWDCPASEASEGTVTIPTPTASLQALSQHHPQGSGPLRTRRSRQSPTGTPSQASHRPSSALKVVPRPSAHGGQAPQPGGRSSRYETSLCNPLACRPLGAGLLRACPETPAHPARMESQNPRS